MPRHWSFLSKLCSNYTVAQPCERQTATQALLGSWLLAGPVGLGRGVAWCRWTGPTGVGGRGSAQGCAPRGLHRTMPEIEASQSESGRYMRRSYRGHRCLDRTLLPRVNRAAKADCTFFRRTGLYRWRQPLIRCIAAISCRPGLARPVDGSAMHGQALPRVVKALISTWYRHPARRRVRGSGAQIALPIVCLGVLADSLQ